MLKRENIIKRVISDVDDREMERNQLERTQTLIL